MEQHNGETEIEKMDEAQEEATAQDTAVKRKRRTIFREIINNVVMILNKYVIANAQVPTSSMETTVMAGDRILVNRLSYVFGEPKRGDIVTFIYPDDGETLYLKRVMGLPGETIAGQDGVVYIDGKPLEEDFTQEVSKEDFGPYTVHKFVERKDIIGKAELSYFPHPRFLK